MIANLSASNELIGKNDYRRLLVSSASSRLICGYVYANAGHGESTQDMVFSGHSLIYENGQLLAEKKPFAKNGLIATEIDLFRLRFERHRNTSFDESSAPGMPARILQPGAERHGSLRGTSRAGLSCLPTGRYSPSAPRQY